MVLAACSNKARIHRGAQSAAIAASLSALVAAGGASASVAGHYPAGAAEAGAQGRANIVYALEHIPTTTGQNALQRMQACGFKIQWSTSWVARQSVDLPAYGTAAGDITVQVLFDRKVGEARLGKDLLARWFIQKGRTNPSSGWARLIQTSSYPMSVDPLMHC